MRNRVIGEEDIHPVSRQDSKSNQSELAQKRVNPRRAVPRHGQDSQSAQPLDEQCEPSKNGVYSPPQFPGQDQDYHSDQRYNEPAENHVYSPPQFPPQDNDCQSASQLDEHEPVQNAVTPPLPEQNLIHQPALQFPGQGQDSLSAPHFEPTENSVYSPPQLSGQQSACVSVFASRYVEYFNSVLE